jgi:hypothetical protein
MIITVKWMFCLLYYLVEAEGNGIGKRVQSGKKKVGKRDMMKEKE